MKSLSRLFQVISISISLAAPLSSCVKNGDDRNNGQNSSCLAEFTATSNGAEMGVGDKKFSGNEIAQSFIARGTGDISLIRLNLLPVGELKDNDLYGFNESAFVTLTITTDRAGAPDNVLGTSDPLRLGTMTFQTPQYYRFTFSNPIPLEQGTTYWLRVTPSYGRSESNFVKWLGYNGRSNYSDGIAKYEDGNGKWSTIDIGEQRDLNFKVGC